MHAYFKTLVAAILLTPMALYAQSPYAGWEKRTIKSLSEEQVADLRAGRGMGLALAAELNGLPGPKHVLEQAEPLGLTAEQREQTEALYSAMQAEAQSAGAAVLEAETRLDRLFAGHPESEQAVEQAITAAGSAWSRLRWTHLRYHLRLRDILTPAQIHQYQIQRGYAGGHGAHAHRP